MTPSPAAPAPEHLLRLHSTGVTCLWISDDNERICSGDDSGIVMLTSTRSLRPLSRWKAHQNGLLGVQEWGDQIITHARDNKLHVWSTYRDLPSSARIGSSVLTPGTHVPNLYYSMDVNALNYCRFSLLPLRSEYDTSGLPSGRETSPQEPSTSGKAFVALPNLVESSLADVWILPSCQRVHAAIGKPSEKATRADGRGDAGIIMSMHIFFADLSYDRASTSGSQADELRIVCAYENGSVTLRRYADASKPHSIEGRGWETIWTSKLHAESIMSMRVSRDNSFALSVSADHIIGRYNLTSSSSTDCIAFRTKHPGHGAIAFHDDGRVCAIGGWDGKIRLYSTKSMKPLGTLTYHKQACQALEFARASERSLSGSDNADDDDLDEFDAEARCRWLIGGSKDARVTIWELIDFTKG